MSVVGFDFGNLTCYVAVARSGGVETVANEYSDRCTPCFASFTESRRFTGVSAKNQMITNVANTVTNFKRLIGRKYRDPIVQEELAHIPNTVVELPGGDIGIQVNYLDGQAVLTPVQLVAMILTQLKETAESNLKTKVVDCVISVPSYFTDRLRRAMLDAAQVAGLNCLRLMNDTAAVCLHYALYRMDTISEEKPQHVVFIDMGHSATQVAVCAFTKGKAKIVATAADPSLGGRDFDWVLRNHFSEQFKTKYRIDTRSRAKAWLRLEQECEKLKKLMSSNNNDLPLSIECFLDDKDVSSIINRTAFEDLSASLLNRFEVVLDQALLASGLQLDDISSVEIVGGSTRIPAIKQIIRKVFGKDCSTSLNADEAVSRGCAIMCAMISPTFKVREIELMDAATYPVNVAWTAIDSQDVGLMEIFPKFHNFPATKILTLYRKEQFDIKVSYPSNCRLYDNEHQIGSFLIQNVVPSSKGEAAKVKVKVRMNANGTVSVFGATMTENLDATNSDMAVDETPQADSKAPGQTPADNTETPHKAEPASAQTQDDSSGSSNTKSAEDKKAPEAKKAKKTTKQVELAVESLVPSLSKIQVNNLHEKEVEMLSQIKLERERADAKNAVEEYVYDMRNKLGGHLAEYITVEAKSALQVLLEETENWLYDEGDSQVRQVYANKLNDLKKLGDPVVDRYKLFQEIPGALDSLGQAVQHFSKAVALHRDHDEQYSHIEPAEMAKVQIAVNKSMDLLNEWMNKIRAMPKHETPSFTASVVLNEKRVLESTCNPIVTKPKPKVEPPVPETPATGAPAPSESNQTNTPNVPSMEVD